MPNEEYKLDVVYIKLVKGAEILSDKPFSNPENVTELLGKYMCELDRETAAVINLKSDLTPINVNFLSMGSLNQSIVHPREFFKSCILSNAANVILMHSHPSGNIEPSIEDIQITDRLIFLCDMMGIPLIDHIIVGGENTGYFSFKEQGLLEIKDKEHKNECQENKQVNKKRKIR